MLQEMGLYLPCHPGTAGRGCRIGKKASERFVLEEHDKRYELAPTGRLPTFMDALIEKNLLKLETFYR